MRRHSGISGSLFCRTAALQRHPLEYERKISLAWSIARVGCLWKGDAWIRSFCSLVRVAHLGYLSVVEGGVNVGALSVVLVQVSGEFGSCR